MESPNFENSIFGLFYTLVLILNVSVVSTSPIAPINMIATICVGFLLWYKF